VQRRKEEAADYRYFPDPDLVPVIVDESWLNEVRQSLGELPSAQRQRLIEHYGLSPYDANVLVHQGRALVAYFEETARAAGDAKTACNWVTNQVLATLNERQQKIADFPLRPDQLGELIAEIRAKGLNNQRAREVYGHMLQTGVRVQDALKTLGIREISESELREVVRRQLAAHDKAVADYRQGNLRAIDRVKGAVMKETGGMARMDLVQRLLEEELKGSPGSVS
jgi:aspartyl-tRNA(Asn)/glutamyl-tRNA(Gln) amidotransferase subunit B